MARGTNTRSTRRPAPKKASPSGEDVAQTTAEQEALRESNAVASEALKQAGNAFFASGDNLSAVAKFTEAIEKDSTNHILYSNRSAANLNLSRTRDAVSDAELCTTIKPTWAKGYSRLGAALLADKQAIAARQAYQAGLRIEPSNEQLKEGLKLAETGARAEEAKLAELKAEADREAAIQAEKEAEETRKAEPVIGIDLGTTYSCVAWWGPEGVEVLTDEDGAHTVPSYVGWGANGEKMIGHRAKQNAARNIKSTLFDVKRIIGQKMKDEAVVKEAKRLPFGVVEGMNGKPMVEVEVKGKKVRYEPEQVSAMILGRMKAIAEARIGRPVSKAVVTVPAYFNDAQRQATKAAGRIAGLEVLRIINEPTAAALAYGLDQAATGDNSGSNVMVFDLGGGTFDVSVLHLERGMFEVKATGGDTRLGGEDFDAKFMDTLVTEFRKKCKCDISAPKDLAKLKSAAERAKRELSSRDQVTVEMMVDGDEYSLPVTREKFEQVNATLFGRTLDTVKAVLKDAKMNPSDIDEIVLVGGSTRIPQIQSLLMEYFGGRQLCRSINPDEAVAYGAAVQGAILSGVRHSACKDIVLVDVTPLSLGIEVEGKHMSIIIPRNTPIPCTKKDSYTTMEDYGRAIDVKIFEGERPTTAHNHLLGEFTIDGIEQAKRGEPKIVVTFALDSNGILDVSAVDQKTESKADCRISNACKGLSPEEIERMLREAEECARADEELVRKVELKSELETMALDLTEEGSGSGKVLGEECLDWLEDLDLATVGIGALELRHRELQRA